MAVDVLSYELPSLVVSPRISFSHDLNNPSSPQEQVPRSDAFLTLDFDFDFCPISTAQPPQLSSADELFSGGKILPTQIKNPPPHPQTPNTTHPEDTTKKRLKEFLLHTEEEEDEEEEGVEKLQRSSSRSFWQFRRSASLNCENGGRRGLLRSLQVLGRSNSTGSAPNHKQAAPNHKQGSKKHRPVFATARSNPPSSSGSNAYCYGYNNPSQKPPLKKSCSGNYYYYYTNSNGNGGGVRLISPVLNISPNYFSKGSVNLFGFGSLFCKGKSKKKKK